MYKNHVSHIAKTAAYTSAACLLALSFLAGNAQAAVQKDVAADFLKQANIIQGDATTGDLRLDSEINRAELMKILVNSATNTVDTFTYRNCLADINSEWFARYVCWANEHNYVGGYPDGAFHAGRSVNRAEALKMVSEVFHLDYKRMAPVADESIWYDIYVRNAQRQRIIEAPLTAEQLAQPVTRGEMFDYLFRAMAVSHGASDTFTDAEYKNFPTEYFAEKEQTAAPRTLTPAEDALIRVLRAQLAYGYQPMTGTGSGMVRFSGEGAGMTFAVRLDASSTDKYDGTKTEFDGFNQDTQLVLDVATTGADNVSFKTVADISLAGSGTTMLYGKLNNFELVDVEAPIDVKLALNEAKSQVDSMKDIWFSLDLSTLSEGVPLENSLATYQMLGSAAIDFLEKGMKSSAEPYIDVIASDEGTQSTLLLKPNANRLHALVEAMVMGTNPSANRYLVRQTERTFESALNMFAKNMSLLLTYDKTDALLRKVATILDPVTIELPEERTKLTLELAAEQFYNYDKDFSLIFPESAQDLMTFFQGESSAEDESMARPPEAPLAQ